MVAIWCWPAALCAGLMRIRLGLCVVNGVGIVNKTLVVLDMIYSNHATVNDIAIQIVNGHVCAALIFIGQERKASRLTSVLVPARIDKMSRNCKVCSCSSTGYILQSASHDPALQ